MGQNAFSISLSRDKTCNYEKYKNKSCINYSTEHVPAFKVNLVSVTKLIQSLNCFLDFHNNSSLIKHISTKKTIDSANIHGGCSYLVCHHKFLLFIRKE